MSFGPIPDVDWLWVKVFVWGHVALAWIVGLALLIQWATGKCA
jgi:hypothetical protein